MEASVNQKTPENLKAIKQEFHDELIRKIDHGDAIPNGKYSTCKYCFSSSVEWVKAKNKDGDFKWMLIEVDQETGLLQKHQCAVLKKPLKQEIYGTHQIGDY